MNKRRIGVISGGTGGGAMAASMLRALQFFHLDVYPLFLFLETNWDSLVTLRQKGIPKDNLLLIGKDTLGGRGSYNDPAKAANALREVKDRVMAMMAECDIIYVVVTGGKGTGMGVYPLLCEWAAELGKWLSPVIARPGLGEVDAATQDRVDQAIARVDKLGFRQVVIDNDAILSPKTRLPRQQAFDLGNKAMGGGLGSYALMTSDSMMIDISDAAKALAGPGQVYLGHASRVLPKTQPSDGAVDQLVKELISECLDVPFFHFPGAVDHVVWGIHIPDSWDGWVETEFVKQGTKRLFEKFGGVAPKRTLPPASFPIPVSPNGEYAQCGISLIMTNDTGEHAPLPLPKIASFDLDAIEVDSSFLLEPLVLTSPRATPMAVSLSVATPVPAAEVAPERDSLEEFPVESLPKRIYARARGWIAGRRKTSPQIPESPAAYRQSSLRAVVTPSVISTETPTPTVSIGDGDVPDMPHIVLPSRVSEVSPRGQSPVPASAGPAQAGTNSSQTVTDPQRVKERAWTIVEFANYVNRRLVVALEVAKAEFVEGKVTFEAGTWITIGEKREWVAGSLRNRLGLVHFRQAVKTGVFHPSWKLRFVRELENEYLDLGNFKLEDLTTMPISKISGDKLFIQYVNESFGTEVAEGLVEKAKTRSAAATDDSGKSRSLWRPQAPAPVASSVSVGK